MAMFKHGKGLLVRHRIIKIGAVHQYVVPRRILEEPTPNNLVTHYKLRFSAPKLAACYGNALKFQCQSYSY